MGAVSKVLDYILGTFIVVGLFSLACILGAFGLPLLADGLVWLGCVVGYVLNFMPSLYQMTLMIGVLFLSVIAIILSTAIRE